MINEKTWYRHNRTGKDILVVGISTSLEQCNGEYVDTLMAHVRANGAWKYMKVSTVEKNYSPITWQQHRGIEE